MKEPNDDAYRSLKLDLTRNWAENRPREFSQMEQAGTVISEVKERALSLWGLYTQMISQGLEDYQARELLANSISPALEDDHPLELMDLVEDLEEYDRLEEERTHALAAGGEELIKWDRKVLRLRKRTHKE